MTINKEMKLSMILFEDSEKEIKRKNQKGSEGKGPVPRA
jgi:hypothetical protein